MIPTIYNPRPTTRDPPTKNGVESTDSKTGGEVSHRDSADASAIMTFITEYADEAAKKYEQTRPYSGFL